MIESQVTLEALTQQLNCFENKLQHGNGICSAFVLDTSETMAGEGFRLMKKAVFDILDGKHFFFFFSITYLTRIHYFSSISNVNALYTIVFGTFL